MKQTAVEWLVEYLKLHGIELNNDAIHNVINQAKEMEKQQLGKFYNHGQWTTVWKVLQSRSMDNSSW